MRRADLIARAGDRGVARRAWGVRRQGIAESRRAGRRRVPRRQTVEGMQSPNGGFGFWRRDGETWPYLSIHVAHALERAKEKGFNTPPEMLERSKQYLRNIEQNIPHW